MELLYDSQFEGNDVLCIDESRHAINVMRHKVGDILNITNGNGVLYQSRIIDANPKKCTLELVTTTTVEPSPHYLHMAVAPTKNIDRFEWFLEKATELGINEITPIICNHSERDKVRTDRLEKILVAGMKQSLKYYLPKLNEPVKVQNLITNASGYDSQFILHCRRTLPHLFISLKKSSRSLILIGPEGDFSIEEVGLAIKNGFTEAGLGTARLRTETAAIAACHVFNLKNDI